MITRARQLLGRKFIQDTLVLQVGKVGLVALSLISTVLVGRLLGPEGYGDFGLALSFLLIWQTLDLTGIGPSTSTRLAIAIGARDEGAILDLMGNYVKVSAAISVAFIVLIALVGGQTAAQLYEGKAQIGVLALGLAVAGLADALYGLLIIGLQSRRSMRTLALMQNANQLALTVLVIGAVVISPTPESLVIARIVYSYGTMLLAFVVYERQRTDGQVTYPPLRAVFARAVTVSPRPYWRFGVANAVDKNLAQLFIQIPIQVVGIFAGAHAVGYLNLALNGIAQAGIFTSAVFDNMQAVVPQAVGRGDYAGLRRDFLRVLVALGVGGVIFYSVVALVAPLLIPLVLGERWIPAVPPLVALALYGAVTTFGGNFGPLYRAFNLMRQIIVIKLLGLVFLLPAGIILLQGLASRQVNAAPFFGMALTSDEARAGAGALGGALLIDVVFLLSVALTAWVTLPELKKRAE
jgi:lipopolysaccharide exporter